MRGPRRRRVRPALLVTLACLAAALAAATTLSVRLTQRPPAPVLGVSLNNVFNDPTGTPAWREMQLAAAERHGVRLARADAFWEATEPLPPPRAGVHVYNWGFDDRVANGLSAHGMQWLAILDYAPPWATTDPTRLHAPPARSADYGAYAAAFARRYGRGGTFWRAHAELASRPVTTYEIWNEPNSRTFWAPRPDAARYAELYLVAREAIHRVDPRARVIVGGLVPGRGFVPAMYRARPRLRGAVDGVGLHPYAAGPQAVFAHVRDLRELLAGLGQADVPIFVTEFGWQSVVPGPGEQFASTAEKAAFLARTTDALVRSDCGVEGVVIYSWITPEHDRGSADDWYGVYRRQGEETPSSRALRRVLEDGPAGTGKAEICPAGGS